MPWRVVSCKELKIGAETLSGASDPAESSRFARIRVLSCGLRWTSAALSGPLGKLPTKNVLRKKQTGTGEGAVLRTEYCRTCDHSHSGGQLEFNSSNVIDACCTGHDGGEIVSATEVKRFKPRKVDPAGCNRSSNSWPL
jgi:hypothetical protein